MKTILKLDENWLSNQRIASKIFSMLKCLLQAIANNFERQLQVNYVRCLCRAQSVNVTLFNG